MAVNSEIRDFLSGIGAHLTAWFCTCATLPFIYHDASSLTLKDFAMAAGILSLGTIPLLLGSGVWMGVVFTPFWKRFCILQHLWVAMGAP